MFRLALRCKFLVYLLLLAFIITLVACDSAPATAPAQVALATATEPIPTATVPAIPTAQPTATPVKLLKTSEWATVKSTGAEVKSRPAAGSTILEKLEPFTVVGWQNKLPDESWWERAGGGWIARNEVVIYKTEAEARKNVPQPTATPAPVTPPKLVDPQPASINLQTRPTAKPVAGTDNSNPPAAPVVASTDTLPTTGPAATASSPKPAQASPTAAPSPVSASCKPGQIKGNRNSKIYHVPGQRDYNKTTANVECFNTEAEAQKAGYRKAAR